MSQLPTRNVFFCMGIIPGAFLQDVQPASNEPCSICYEPLDASKPYNDADEIVMTRECKHLFHRACLLEWLTGSNQSRPMCPYCRHELFNADRQEAGPNGEAGQFFPQAIRQTLNLREETLRVREETLRLRQETLRLREERLNQREEDFRLEEEGLHLDLVFGEESLGSTPDRDPLEEPEPIEHIVEWDRLTLFMRQEGLRQNPDRNPHGESVEPAEFATMIERPRPNPYNPDLPEAIADVRADAEMLASLLDEEFQNCVARSNPTGADLPSNVWHNGRVDECVEVTLERYHSAGYPKRNYVSTELLKRLVATAGLISKCASHEPFARTVHFGFLVYQADKWLRYAQLLASNAESSDPETFKELERVIGYGDDMDSHQYTSDQTPAFETCAKWIVELRKRERGLGAHPYGRWQQLEYGTWMTEDPALHLWNGSSTFP